MVIILLILAGIPLTRAWSMGFDITGTPEGGYLIAGATGLNYGYSHAWLIKVDRNGNEVWDKTYGGNCRSQAWSVARVEGGYVFGGITGCRDDDAWIVKVDENGNMVWSRVFGYGGGGDSATAVARSGKGMLAAVTIAPCRNGCTNEDVWIVKFGANGTEIWRKEIDNRKYDSIKRIIRTTDGGYIGVGATGDYENGSYTNLDLWVLKLDENGSVEWSDVFDYGLLDVAWDVVEQDDGFVIVGEVWTCALTGSTSTSAKCVYPLVYPILLKLDKDGHPVGEKKIECGGICAGWGTVDDVVAGVAVKNSSELLWICNRTDCKNIEGNFTFLPLIFGPVRVEKAEDGFVVLASENNSVWLGKFNSNLDLMWEKTFRHKLEEEHFGKPSAHSYLFQAGAAIALAAILVAVLRKI